MDPSDFDPTEMIPKPFETRARVASDRAKTTPAPPEPTPSEAVSLGGILLFVGVILIPALLGIGLLAWCASEHTGLFLIQVAIFSVLVIAGWIRAQWEFLEHRFHTEVEDKLTLLLGILAAAAVGIGLPASNIPFPGLIPPLVAGWIVGLAFFSMGLIVLSVGVRLAWRDLERGMTYRRGGWAGRTDVVPGYSHTDLYHVEPCFVSEEPGVFYSQVLTTLFAALLASAIFWGPPVLAFVVWCRS